MSENILIPGLHDYLDRLLPKRSDVFLEIEKYAEMEDFPIVGPLVGNILFQYAQLTKAKRILELGSGFGYSALWFSQASPNEIICTDLSKDNIKRAMVYFEKAGVTDKIQFIEGDGLDILRQVEGEFDIIFNDIEKEDYPEAFKEAVPRLRKGGLLITDNVLWDGKVLDSSPKEEATKGVKEYNRLAFSDPQVLSVIIPIRDGLGVSIKM